jgi:hypothetical protein
MATRSDVAEYLREHIGALYLKAGRTTTDTTDGIKIPLDETWRTLGLISVEEPFDDLLIEAANTLSLAYGYRLIMGWLATKYSISASNPSTRIDSFQMYQAAKDLAAEAYANAGRFGYRNPQVSYHELDVADSIDRRRQIAAQQSSWTEFG